ncbi:MAG: hypothetical protein J6W41_02915 [Alphaproteobacteria bacterium]|nr:hypothetical protein [Alphaproteobacteria bacterium]
MAFDFKRFLGRAEKPALFVMMAALLGISVKNCSDGDKSRETNDVVKSVAEKIDSVRMDADTVKAYSVATYNVAVENNKIVNRTEEKVDALQETADTILAHVDSCCDCNKKPVVRPRRLVPRDTVPAAKPEPCTPDTVVIVKRDTVYADKPKDTNKGVFISIQCIEKTKRVR